MQVVTQHLHPLMIMDLCHSKSTTFGTIHVDYIFINRHLSSELGKLECGTKLSEKEQETIHEISSRI